MGLGEIVFGTITAVLTILGILYAMRRDYVNDKVQKNNDIADIKNRLTIAEQDIKNQSKSIDKIDELSNKINTVEQNIVKILTILESNK